MSYILDALKKSEKERSLENVPTLRPVANNQEKRVPLRWFLITVVVLVVGLLLLTSWIIWFSQPSQRHTVDIQQQTQGTETQPTAVQPVSVPGSRDTAGPVAADTETLLNSPVLFSELDPAVRARIPTLTVNVLSYAEDSSKRFVMIDQSIFKQGEIVKGGVVVDEIRNSDVIFKLDDVRFILKP